MKALLAALGLLPFAPLLGGLAGERAAQPLQVKPMTHQAKITPFLWFDDRAEEAMHFYLSVFEEGEILGESRWGAGAPAPEGSLMSATFRLAGQELMVLNGGPLYRFNEAISLMVHCESQEELDSYWDRLSAGGEPGRCGWLKDKYGLSWQVIPRVLGEMLQDPDPAKTGRVAAAMMQMDKLDIARLQEAYAGK